MFLISWGTHCLFLTTAVFALMLLKSYWVPSVQVSDLQVVCWMLCLWESDRFQVTDEIIELNWQLQNGHNYISCEIPEIKLCLMGMKFLAVPNLLVFDNQLIFGTISYKELFQLKFLSALKAETPFPWILRKLKKTPRQFTFAIFRHNSLLSLNPLTWRGSYILLNSSSRG